MSSKELIGIIAPASVKYVPYIQYYINIFKNNNVDFRIISWNRMNTEQNDIDFSYNYEVKDSDRKKMFLGYFKFASACKKYIKKNKISKLVILTAAPAFFLGVSYLKKFSNNYILDIRDDSPLVRRFPKYFATICSMAKQIVVSSNKFNEWIPSSTMLCHNADVTQIEKYLDLPVKKDFSSPISIAFAGMMIESKKNIEMLEHMGKDERFKFWFIGRSNPGKEAIEKYVENSGLKNVFFRGTYNKDEINDIYKEKADLINIIRAKTTVNRNALPNKLYDAVISGVPVIVFDHNEAIAEYVLKYNLGLVVKDDMQNLGDTIVSSMNDFDYFKYEQGRRDFLAQVLEDMKNFSDTVLTFAN